jgi:hypothetical protein
MGNEAFEELEELEQFEDPELKLPEGLTREGLWEEMKIAEHGDEGADQQDLHEMLMGNPRYHPYVYHHGLASGMNGMDANGMTVNGFVPAAINGLGVYPPNGPGVNGYLGGAGVSAGFGNGNPRPDLAVNLAALLPNGGDTSSSQSPATPLFNGTGPGLASASQLSPVMLNQSLNSSDFANGTVDFDIDEYLHFEDPDAVKIDEEDIFGTKTE